MDGRISRCTTTAVSSAFNQLGIYDSYFGMIIPLLADAAGVFIMKNFFESIPVSVEEQAKVDGAGTFRTFSRGPGTS
ncbi:carbohydrate ABC transporter permease [Arthrobacter oryzae]|uniref:Carbohydrate ABC transporter permease n=1 Tax=Arthrobacter oryzae TaxID=409290 RepID=A0A3N0BSF1_9MICC|nr:carbohydrate ABC transporter permease [Arthrobacter oryzae]